MITKKEVIMSKLLKKIKQHFIFFWDLYFCLCICVLAFLFLAFISLKSQTKYNLPTTKKLIDISREIALNQIGEMEIKANYSPQIMKYLNSVNLNSPNPYCAAGQYYCFAEANKIINTNTNSNTNTKSNLNIPIYKTGSTRLMYNKAKINGHKTRYLAAKDDLIVWKKGITQFGHLERIYSIESNNNSNNNTPNAWVTTIAFNVECGNGVNQEKHKKEGVCFKRGNIYHILGRLSILGIIGFDTTK